jgi:hypothetical protein
LQFDTDTEDGLTGSEIVHLLATCEIEDVDPTITKCHRLYNALPKIRTGARSETRVLGFT